MKSDFGDDLLPRRATPGSAGYDFFFPKRLECFPLNVKASDSYYVVDTGIHLEEGDLQPDEVMLLVPRSSLGFKYGFYLANSIGVIDSDYRDSIKVSFNIEKSILNLKRGDRFMQGIIVKFGLLPQDHPIQNERTGGIGSTDNAPADVPDEKLVMKADADPDTAERILEAMDDTPPVIVTEQPVKRRGRKPKVESDE